MSCVLYFGWSLSILATITTVFTTMYSSWKVSSPVSSQGNFETLHSTEGLWRRCVTSAPGQLRCDNYDTALLGLPAELQVQRALMVLSVIALVTATVTAALALPCASCFQGKKKTLTMRVAGILALLAGAMTITAVSWYAAGVIREFKFDQINQNSFAYEFGPALYVGWIAGGFALISGSLMACCASSEEDEDEYDPRPVYKPGKQYKAGRNAEYV